MYLLVLRFDPWWEHICFSSCCTVVGLVVKRVQYNCLWTGIINDNVMNSTSTRRHLVYVPLVFEFFVMLVVYVRGLFSGIIVQYLEL